MGYEIGWNKQGWGHFVVEYVNTNMLTIPKTKVSLIYSRNTLIGRYPVVADKITYQILHEFQDYAYPY